MLSRSRRGARARALENRNACGIIDRTPGTSRSHGGSRVGTSLKGSHVVAGFVAVLVGYTGTVAIVFQAADSAGATPEQVNSWLLVLGVGLGLTSIGLSWWYLSLIHI